MRDWTAALVAVASIVLSVFIIVKYADEPKSSHPGLIAFRVGIAIIIVAMLIFVYRQTRPNK